ncbi:MAG: ATP-binding cassette domain-containing protein [Desulfobacteraceae bacterium]|jgi:ABC-type dipeptide/oligopeptide/nickel transport system ATPase subunit
MLEARNIMYKYADHHPWVLRNANLSIAKGEVVGLFGPSGQGKTTLGKILGGFLIPTSGEVLLDQGRLPKKGYCPVQMIFQHPETALNPRWHMMNTLEEAGPISEYAIRSFLVEKEWMDRRPYELSGGELQRVAIARALRPETRYIIADEITTMLDALTQSLLWNMVLSFVKTHHAGVLVISHDAGLMERICDRIMDMADIQT